MQIWVDLDGCLADFDKKVLEICGKSPKELKDKEMWPQLAKYPNFFESLEFMPNANILWEFVKPYNPKILTGIPFGGWASKQKRNWCAKHLSIYGEDVITCWSKEKHTYCKPGDILIDDRAKLKEAWEKAGGIFILHDDSKIDETLEQLRKLI